MPIIDQFLPKRRICLALLLAFILAALGFTLAASQAPEYEVYLPVVQKDNDSRWRWDEPNPLSLSPKPNNNPLAIIDHAGQLHLFWDSLYSPRLIYHAVLGPEGWSTPAPVAETLGISSALYPPVVDVEGNLHLIWRNMLGFGIENPYRLMYAKYEDNHWLAEEQVIRTDMEIKGMVQVDDRGGVHTIYLGGLITTRAFHTTRTSSGWTSPIEVKPSHYFSLVWPDRYGGIHFYDDDYYGNLSYSYWRNGEFTIANKKASARISGRQTQLDGENYLHVFWKGQVPVPGGQVYGVNYFCLDPDLNASPQQALSGDKEISGSIIKAADNEAKIALGWKEALSGQVQLVVLDGYAKRAEKTIPFPEGVNWELKSLAISHSPGKACAVARKLYTDEYTAVCAEVDW